MNRLNRVKARQERAVGWQDTAISMLEGAGYKEASRMAGLYYEDIFPGWRLARIETQIPLPELRADHMIKVMMKRGNEHFTVSGTGNTLGAAMVSSIYDGEPMDQAET